MIRNTRFSLARMIVIAAVLLGLIPAYPATADELSGVIEGIVTDTEENPLAGVTVTVSGPALDGKRFAVTGEDGRFRFDDLPAAEGYQVDFEHEHYAAVIRMNVSLSAGEAVPLAIRMKLAEMSTSRKIQDPPMIDVSSSAISEEFTLEFLDDIPNGRTYVDAVSMVAGVAGLEEPYRRGHNSSFHVHGGDRTDNVYLLDGLETTNTATTRSGMSVPWEAIETVELLTGGLPAEYGRATGGLVNVVTRSGGNKLHGSLYAFYTDKGLKQDVDEEHAYMEEEFDELEWGASIGGRIVRDRLWFFATYDQYTRTIEGIGYDDEVIEREDVFNEGLANLTWQVNPDNKLKAQFAANSAVWDSRDSMNPALDPSAWAEQEDGDSLWQLQWTSIFGPDLFLEARVGRHESTTTVSSVSAGFHDPRFVDQQYGAGTIIYGNVSSITDVHRPRMQYQAALNWYRGDWAGEHDFKFGAEYQDLEYETDLIYPDTYTINRPGGGGYDRPDQWLEVSDVNYLDTGKILTLYIQDSWTWNEDWTFNLGLRWEEQEQKNDVGELLYSFDNLLSPRLGAAWDISGDGRSRLFTHYGRYHHAVGLALASQLNRQSEETWRYEGDYETGDWEEISYYEGYENPTTVDENLEPNVEDEYILGYELEFASDFVAGARLIYNRQTNMIEDVLANEDDIRYGHDNQYLYHITNVQTARRQYRGLELSCRKRLSHNYQFLAVLTLSEAKGSVDYHQSAEGLGIYADFEEMKYNRYGNLPWDDKQYFKINGSYHLPWGIIIGASINYRSGRPYNRIDPYLPEEAWNFGYTNQYYLEPRGSNRMDSVWWLDVRLRKDFEIGPTTLSLTADAFNLTDNQDAIGRFEIDSYRWGEDNDWMGPGYFVLGGKLTF